MKKFLAFMLSCVLVFTLVAFVACSNGTNVGGNNFKEVNLEDEATRTEFVNALSAKVDVNALFDDPTSENWTYGLEQKSTSKVAFDLSLTTVGENSTKYSAKGNLQLSETVKASIKNSGKISPDVAASAKISAKGNLNLPDEAYALLGGYNEKIAEMVGVEEFDLAQAVKTLVTNFDYTIEAYADADAALISVSDSLYGKLPEFVTEMLGSRKIKLAYGAMTSTYAAATSGQPGLDEEEVKETINEVIDEIILPFKISVSVATHNGYALRITVTKQSILTILDAMVGNGAPEWLTAAKETVEKSLSSDAKFELTVRVDKNGMLAQVAYEFNFKLNVDTTIDGFGAIKGSFSLSSSQELKKFNGKITKPNDADYKVPAFMGA